MKKNIIWDTTKHSIDFPEEIKKIFFKNLIKNRISFCELIEKLSKKRTNNVDWWHTILSSRNPYNSDLHKYITILDTLDVLLKKDFKPISDMRASKNYRLEVAENLLVKFFIETKTKKLFRVYQ